jgi:hypothetical protein
LLFAPFQAVLPPAITVRHSGSPRSVLARLLLATYQPV